MAEEKYVKIAAIYKKLKAAEMEHQTIYIHAPAGFGKTAAIRYFYRTKKYYYLTGIEGYLKEMPDGTQIKEDTVVIDDISWITDPESQNYVKTLITSHKKHVVLAGRSHVPAWLKVTFVEEGFALADTRDLLLSKNEIQKALERQHVSVTEEELDAITEDINGSGMVLSLLIYRMREMAPGEHYGKRIYQTVLVDMFHYFDYAFFERWSPEIRMMLLAVAGYPQFDATMAQTLTGDCQVARYIEQMQAVGDFCYTKEDGSYELHFALNEFLQWKRKIIWNGEMHKINHERAGLYYELKGCIADALEQYSLAGNHENIRKLLIENAKKQPGTAHFYETRNYYLALSEDEIRQESILMSGLSMLYSLLLQPEKSEEWYQKLTACEKMQPRGSLEQKEARSRIAYLDIALPHRGSTRLTDILKDVEILCRNKEIQIPEFSVTNNLLSIMNGGKDFCKWSLSDRKLAKLMKKPIELVLGEFGAGLVNTALAESLFEKGSEDDYELLTLLNAGYAQAEARGKMEICFVAVGILAKIHMRHRQPDVAAKLVDDFEQKVIKEGANQLMPNIQAFKAWLSMQCGRTESVEKWLSEAPNENQEFYILDRYRYMIKLRAYILFGRYEEAWNLSERLQFYFTQYDRCYMTIENQFLRAIMLYRQGRENWKEALQKAVQEAEAYHFIWIAAGEGSALLPLLQKCKKDSFLQNDYGKNVWKQTEEMACSYPHYLQGKKQLSEPLTEMEEKILRLHCMGVQTGEILKQLSIQESTLKFHNTKIYRKLGVRNRQEAVYAAKSSGLIQTGGKL